MSCARHGTGEDGRERKPPGRWGWKGSEKRSAWWEVEVEVEVRASLSVGQAARAGSSFLEH